MASKGRRLGPMLRMKPGQLKPRTDQQAFHPVQLVHGEPDEGFTWGTASKGGEIPLRAEETPWDDLANGKTNTSHTHGGRKCANEASYTSPHRVFTGDIFTQPPPLPSPAQSPDWQALQTHRSETLKKHVYGHNVFMFYVYIVF